ncbi:hypothetical protein KF840_05370, partial [bacterium]|nr:hypothetical protein [bacterium]
MTARKNVRVDSDSKHEKAVAALLPRTAFAEFSRISEHHKFRKAHRRRKLLLYLLHAAHLEPGRKLDEKAVREEFYGDPSPGDLSKTYARSALVDLRAALSGYYNETPRPRKIEIAGFRANLSPATAQGAINDTRADLSPSDAEPLEQFFGEGAAQRPGVIVLQSDSIDRILGAAVNADAKRRLFKARTWINHYDTEGAKTVQGLFQNFADIDVSVPELVISDHETEDRIRVT